MTSDEKLKDVLGAIFKRKGKETSNTRLYDNLPDATKRNLTVTAAVNGDDLPVIVSNPREDYWVIVGTKYIMLIDRGHSTLIDGTKLASVDVNFDEIFTSHKPSKANIKHLWLKDNSGVKSAIEVEQGAPLIGVLNVLMHITMLNQNRTSRAHC